MIMIKCLKGIRNDSIVEVHLKFQMANNPINIDIFDFLSIVNNFALSGNYR